MSIYELDKIINEYYNSKLPQFVECAKTLSHWKKYIVNSFITVEYDGEIRRLSNGPCESLNLILEKINMNGNGFTNFDIYRNRCIFSINKDVPISRKKE